MPTVLRIGPYRFFFYSADRAEPMHIHVERETCEAKFWLQPVRLASDHGFARRELQTVQGLVQEREQELVRRWNEFFGR